MDRPHNAHYHLGHCTAGNETAVEWKYLAINYAGPSALMTQAFETSYQRNIWLLH